MHVKTAVDTVGQLDPDSQSALVVQYRPHAIIIVLDGTAPWEGDDELYSGYYLRQLLNSLVYKYNSKYRGYKKLKNIFVLINKSDKVKEVTLKNLIKKVRDVTRNELKSRAGMSADHIMCMECSLLQDKVNVANAVVQKLALALED